MNRLTLIKQAISSPVNLENLEMLRLSREGNIVTIWFNNPMAYNAVSNRMSDQFIFLFQHLDNDDSVKVIAIRSDLSKIYCSGGNIKDFETRLNNKSNRTAHFRTLTLGNAFRSSKKVLIAVVQGLALGGGFQIALMCDIILCSEKATFSLSQINWGLIPTLGGTQNLSRLIGNKVASRLILTGDRLNAFQAHRLNIAHLITGQNFQQKVKGFLNILASKPLDSLEAGKKAIRLSMQTTLDQGLQHEATISQVLFQKKGLREGISAFVQKRKPNFKDM